MLSYCLHKSFKVFYGATIYLKVEELMREQKSLKDSRNLWNKSSSHDYRFINNITEAGSDMNSRIHTSAANKSGRSNWKDVRLKVMHRKSSSNRK